MAKGGGRRTYVRDANGRFASTGGGGSSRPKAKRVSRGPNRLTRDNAGKITSQGGDGATVRGGRLRTAGGNLRGTQVAKLKTMQGVSYGKATTKKQLQPQKPLSSAEARKQSLRTGARKNSERAARLEAKSAILEKQYRSKDSAYWTQPVKPAGRDQMRAKIGKAVELRDQAAALRAKAASAERQAAKIKPKPIPSSNGNARLDRAIKNQLAVGPRVMRSNTKQWNKRSTALRAQKIYQTGDPLVNVSLSDMSKPGFRVPRTKRR